MSDIYDPTAPEGDAGRSQYVSKKDIKVVGLAVLVFAAACYPVYIMMVRKAQRSVCATNLGAIANAITQYAVLHDDRFPPTMRTNGNEPDLGNTGHPYTWASDIDELMTPRSSFRCPAAKDEEVTWIEGQHKLIPLTYGMYQPFGGTLRTVIPNPDQSILLAETSNLGSMKTYDPHPFKSGFDGFLIGWNNSNDHPDSTSTIATRLAFPETSAGIFKKTGDSRHDGGIHALNCEGSMVLLKPNEANIQMSRDLPSGLWQLPPLSGVKR